MECGLNASKLSDGSDRLWAFNYYSTHVVRVSSDISCCKLQSAFIMRRQPPSSSLRGKINYRPCANIRIISFQRRRERRNHLDLSHRHQLVLLSVYFLPFCLARWSAIPQCLHFCNFFVLVLVRYQLANHTHLLIQRSNSISTTNLREVWLRQKRKSIGKRERVNHCLSGKHIEVSMKAFSFRSHI